MTKTRFIIIGILFLANLNIFAQLQLNQKENIFSYLSNDTTGFYGSTNVHQDEFIKDLMLQRLKNNKKRYGIPGYRINIFKGSGNDVEGISAQMRAEAVKDTFDFYYPEIGSYIKYMSPEFRVYIGDFRTETEALKALKMIRRRYPKAFKVPYSINYLRFE